MTGLGEAAKRWCEEESLPLVPEQDSDATLACAVTLPSEPPLAVRLRISGAQPDRLLLSHALQIALPEEIANHAEAQPRLGALLERVAATRSALVECRLVDWKGTLTAEIAATLHEEGAGKQSFLTALEEIGKTTRVIAWELEAMALTVGLVMEMGARAGSIAERTEALAADAARAVQDLEARATTPEAAPPPAPPPSPKPTPAPSAAGLFCANCGRPAKPEHRFCIGCGSPLKG